MVAKMDCRRAPRWERQHCEERRRLTAHGTLLQEHDVQTADGHGTRAGRLPLFYRIRHGVGQQQGLANCPARVRWSPDLTSRHWVRPGVFVGLRPLSRGIPLAVSIADELICAGLT